MMYCLFYYTQWVADWVPVLPMKPLKLWLGIWILLPSTQGEVIVYQIISHSILKLEKTFFQRFKGIFSYALVWIYETLIVYTLAHKEHLTDEALQPILEVAHSLEDNFEMEKRRRKSRGKQEEIESLTSSRPVLRTQRTLPAAANARKESNRLQRVEFGSDTASSLNTSSSRISRPTSKRIDEPLNTSLNNSLRSKRMN